MMKFISKNAEVTQHDPDFENTDVGDNDEHLEAPPYPILSVKVANKNARICQNENILEGHTGSWPCSLFAPFDSNCKKTKNIQSL